MWGMGKMAHAEVLRTEDVTQADCFAQWQHWISATFVPLECVPLGCVPGSRGPFRGEIARWELGELRVSRVAADPHQARRTSRMIARADAGYYKVGLATLFGEGTGGPPADPAAARRSLLLTVCAWIDRNLGEPGLDPEAIARANHISVRYLHRLFHDQGTSVARWVRESRLDHCRRDLEDPALAERGVLAVARRWGFADAAHFSKIFKAAYGAPPAQYRCAAGAPGSRPGAATSRAARWPAPTARAGRPAS